MLNVRSLAIIVPPIIAMSCWLHYIQILDSHINNNENRKEKKNVWKLVCDFSGWKTMQKITPNMKQE
jgi:hypothetical protein